MPGQPETGLTDWLDTIRTTRHIACVNGLIGLVCWKEDWWKIITPMKRCWMWNSKALSMRVNESGATLHVFKFQGMVWSPVCIAMDSWCRTLFLEMLAEILQLFFTGVVHVAKRSHTNNLAVELVLEFLTTAFTMFNIICCCRTATVVATGVWSTQDNKISFWISISCILITFSSISSQFNFSIHFESQQLFFSGIAAAACSIAGPSADSEKSITSDTLSGCGSRTKLAAATAGSTVRSKMSPKFSVLSSGSSSAISSSCSSSDELSSAIPTNSSSSSLRRAASASSTVKHLRAAMLNSFTSKNRNKENCNCERLQRWLNVPREMRRAQLKLSRFWRGKSHLKAGENSYSLLKNATGNS